MNKIAEWMNKINFKCMGKPLEGINKILLNGFVKDTDKQAAK